MSLLSLRHLSDPDRLQNVSFDIEPGEIVSVLGRHNSGAHRLLELLAYPERYKVNPESLKMEKPLAIGYVRDSLDVFEEMTVFEHLKLCLSFTGHHSQTRVGEVIEKVLRRVRLWSSTKSRLHSPISELSHFDKVRVNLARSLTFRPDLLLLEHPTHVLDPIQVVEYEEIIESLKDKASFLWWTLDMEQAGRISDKVAIFQDKELLEFGLVEQIFTEPKHPDTELFLTRRSHESE